MKIVAKQNTLLERYARRRRRSVGTMKIVAKQNTRIARRMIDWRYALALISGLMIGIAYCHAAQRDERDGYTITAALEWRRAAELMAPVPTAADRCWLQWERIMHLPRRLAGPVSASLDITLAA